MNDMNDMNDMKDSSAQASPGMISGRTLPPE